MRALRTLDVAYQTFGWVFRWTSKACRKIISSIIVSMRMYWINSVAPFASFLDIFAGLVMF